MSVSQCHRSAKSNGENRSENGGASFAALIAGFCNNICQKQTYAVQQFAVLFDHLVVAAPLTAIA